MIIVLPTAVLLSPSVASHADDKCRYRDRSVGDTSTETKLLSKITNMNSDSKKSSHHSPLGVGGKKFLDENFLLKTRTAQKLYRDYAKEMPVIDYHSHLPPQQIADDIQFENLT